MIRIFAEFNGGKRCPVVHYEFNGMALEPFDIVTVESTSVLHKKIVSLSCVPQPDKNQLKLIQFDKTDDDLIIGENQVIDHYVEIKEIEIDGIPLESVLYQSCPSFEHHMPSSWVAMMSQRGYDIPKIYPNTTQLRLNGEWTLTFESPVWQWHTKQLLR